MGIFKAYDIRGTVPAELNPGIAHRIGHGFAAFLREETGAATPVVLAGRDARIHSPAIHAAFMHGAREAGAAVHDAGLCTTPMLYHAVASGCITSGAFPHGGAMVTASHNGPQYNGFKLCRAGAAPISGDTGLERIRELADAAPPFPGQCPLPLELAYPHLGPAFPGCPSGVHGQLWTSYCAHKQGLKKSWAAAPLLAVDPANGMGCLYIGVLKWLGCRIVSVYDTLDGQFPNHEANPLKPANMVATQDLVRRSGALLGVSFDGDADRAAFVDGRGEIVASDLALAVLARHMLPRDRGAGVLFDLRSSRAVREEILRGGGRPFRTRVGHSFMKQVMRREDCLLGGELSGHFYFRSAWHADSSLVAVIEMLNVLGSTAEPLAALVADVKKYAQSGERNFRVGDKDAVMERLAASFPDGEVDWLDGVTVQFANWWFNVRPSNTEPLLRLNVEASSDKVLAQRVAALESLIGGHAE